MTNSQSYFPSRRFFSQYWLLALTLVLSGCDHRQVETRESVPRVKVYTVGKVASGQSRQISGRVQAADKSTLSFGVGGKVVEVIAKKGQVVAKGQLLAQLDEEPFQITLKEARARLSSVRAKLVEAQALYERTNKLFKEGAKSQKELDAVTANLGSVDGEAKGAQSALRKAELDFERVRLVAPFSGQIVEVSIDPFQEVVANQGAVVLQAQGALEVEVRVPETLIRNVDYGQVVLISFPTIADLQVPGVVVSIGAEAEAGNAFPVTVRLSEGNGDLLPGMTATVTFNFSEYLAGKTAYLIPLSAIAIEAGLLEPRPSSSEIRAAGNRAPVFVYDPTDKGVKRRDIIVGELRGNEVEVFEGLAPGEQIVSAGVAFLRDGMKAEIWVPR